MRMSFTAVTSSPRWSSTATYDPVGNVLRNVMERSTPATSVAAMASCPLASLPMTEIKATEMPKSPKLCAMLRATPPGVDVTPPGLDVAGTWAASVLALLALVTLVVKSLMELKFRSELKAVEQGVHG